MQGRDLRAGAVGPILACPHKRSVGSNALGKHFSQYFVLVSKRSNRDAKFSKRVQKQVCCQVGFQFRVAETDGNHNDENSMVHGYQASRLNSRLNGQRTYGR